MSVSQTSTAPEGGALVALHAQLDDLLASDAVCLDPDVQLARAESLAALEAKVQALGVRWIGDVARSDASVEAAGRTPKSWLVEELRLAPADAARRVRAGNELPDCPATRAAFDAGEITLDHVAVITGAMRWVPADLREVVEAALVASALELPPPAVARDVDTIFTALGVEKSSRDAHERRFAQRGVGIDTTLGGTGSLNGTLTAEVREKVAQALGAASIPAGEEDTRTVRQRWHDALGEIADFYLAHHRSLPAVNGERPRVVVTIDLEALRGRLATAWGMLDSGVKISPDVARRLACDAEVIPAVLNAKSEVLDLGRSARMFNTAIRRAAWIRDQGRCTFPKCTRPPCELHHIVWWTRNGPSSLDNSAWLCAFHHWLVHEGRWDLRRNTDGSLTFTAPDGRERSTDPPRHPQAA
jgi:hypothetical protein